MLRPWLKFSVALIALAFMLRASLRRNSSTPIYLDAQQPIESRVDDLIRRMTLKEKVGQMNLPCVYVDQLGKTVPEKMEHIPMKLARVRVSLRLQTRSCTKASSSRSRISTNFRKSQ